MESVIFLILLMHMVFLADLKSFKDEEQLILIGCFPRISK